MDGFNRGEGYTRIADTLFEALLRFPFGKRQYKVLLAVIRKTVGFNKVEDDMASSQLARMCGLDRSHVSRTLNELCRLNVISKRPGRYGQVIGLNRNTASWHWPDHRCQNSPAVGDKTLAAVPIEPMPNQPQACSQISTAADAITAHTIQNTQQTNHKPPLAGRGACLVFPKVMQDREREEAARILRVAGDDAQAILDVLAVMVQAGEVRKSRLAVLGGLVRRYQQGSFDPTPGVHLAEQRQREHARQQALLKHEQLKQRQLMDRAAEPTTQGYVSLREALKGRKS